MNRAGCQIRTDDPEITNHVLWPTELIRLIYQFSDLFRTSAFLETRRQRKRFIFESAILEMIFSKNKFQKKKWVSDLHRTAQPPTLAAFQPWGNSAGAGRTGLTRRKSSNFSYAGKKYLGLTKANQPSA